MTSQVQEVIDAAAAELAANGQVVHLFTTCQRGGSVNAARDDGVACTACQINAIAAARYAVYTDELRESGLS